MHGVHMSFFLTSAVPSTTYIFYEKRGLYGTHIVHIIHLAKLDIQLNNSDIKLQPFTLKRQSILLFQPISPALGRTKNILYYS